MFTMPRSFIIKYLSMRTKSTTPNDNICYFLKRPLVTNVCYIYINQIIIFGEFSSKGKLTKSSYVKSYDCLCEYTSFRDFFLQKKGYDIFLYNTIVYARLLSNGKTITICYKFIFIISSSFSEFCVYFPCF
jgi:hypothetical protein